MSKWNCDVIVHNCVGTSSYDVTRQHCLTQWKSCNAVMEKRCHLHHCEGRALGHRCEATVSQEDIVLAQWSILEAQWRVECHKAALC